MGICWLGQRLCASVEVYGRTDCESFLAVMNPEDLFLIFLGW